MTIWLCKDCWSTSLFQPQISACFQSDIVLTSHFRGLLWLDASLLFFDKLNDLLTAGSSAGPRRSSSESWKLIYLGKILMLSSIWVAGHLFPPKSPCLVALMNSYLDKKWPPLPLVSAFSRLVWVCGKIIHGSN